MLAFMGACLILAGSFGTGAGICMERKKRAARFAQWQQIFERIAGEISYSAIDLPELFTEIGEKETETGDGEIGVFFNNVGERLTDGSGHLLQKIWLEEMQNYFAANNLHINEEKRLLSFPDEIRFPDRMRQTAAISKFSAEFGAYADKLQQKQQDGRKITMVFCLACGMLTAIILA